MAPALPPLSTRRSTKMELRHTPKVAPYVRRDRSKKKKKEGEGSKNGRMDAPRRQIPLLSSPFSSWKLRNLRVILASRFLNIKH